MFGDMKASSDSSPRVKSWMVLGCLGASLLFVLFQGGKLALMVFVIVLVLSVYLFLGQWSGITRAEGARKIRFGRSALDGELEAGATVDVTVEVSIPGYWPVPYVTVRDRLVRNESGELLFEATLVPDWNRRGAVTYQTPPLKRGFYQFGATECLTCDIFGIFEHKGIMQLTNSFMVMPRTIPIRSWNQIYRVHKGLMRHSASTRSSRETTQINGVREYNYGDRLSKIHWNATAKTGVLKSKEFERESLPKTVVVLDRQQAVYRDEDRFELAVSVAASLLQFGRQRELIFELLSAGEDVGYFESSSHTNTLRSMMHHLIRVKPDGAHSLRAVLEDKSRLFSPGTCIVLITPVMGEPILKLMGWLELLRMIPCHIGLADSPHAAQAWTRQLELEGKMGCGIHKLDDLPVALGGGG